MSEQDAAATVMLLWHLHCVHLKTCRSHKDSEAVQMISLSPLHPFHICEKQGDLAGCHHSSYAGLGDPALLLGQNMGEAIGVLLHQLPLLLQPLQETNKVA